MTKEEMKKIINTLKQTSYDKTNNKFMSNIERDVIDFDEVKKRYIRSLNRGPSNTCYSNDALIEKDGEWTFIEFKNGIIDPKTNATIKMKIYDSLLIFLELVDRHIDYSRKKVNYILVFNSDYIDKKNFTKQFDKNEYNKYNSSQSRADILFMLEDKAGEFGKPQFGLGRLERFIFKNVKTIPIWRFDAYVKTIM